MCRALGLKVLIVSKSFNNVKDEYSDYHSCDLNAALEQADIISFHCKPNFDGASVIGSKELNLMKDTALIINTARGNLVSEVDLCEAIKENKIGGAAIDVFETEPATNNALFGLENILLTPHIAASTSEAQVIVAEMVANQFVEYFLNNKVINEVT